MKKALLSFLTKVTFVRYQKIHYSILDVLFKMCIKETTNFKLKRLL